MRKALQSIAMASCFGFAISGSLSVDGARAAAPATLCDEYLSSKDDPGALHQEVAPNTIAKRMRLILPACKAALADYPEDGRVHALLARLYTIRGETPVAFQHAQTSADLGYPYGAYLVAIFYARDPMMKDHAESVRWMMKSAELGLPLAMEQVAKAYVVGQGVAKDPQTALNWFVKAARAGLKKAFLSLGYMYEEGLSGQRNLKYALIYYTEAKELGVNGSGARIEALESKATKAKQSGGLWDWESPFSPGGDLFRYDLYARDAFEDRVKVTRACGLAKSNSSRYESELDALAGGSAEHKSKIQTFCNLVLNDPYWSESAPAKERTPEGWDWYERRFEPPT